jgi:hypothetical protein
MGDGLTDIDNDILSFRRTCNYEPVRYWELELPNVSIVVWQDGYRPYILEQFV